MDEARIRTKLKELEAYIDELAELKPENSSRYFNSLEKRRAIERQLQIMIECVIDTCYLVASELKIGPPKDDENLLDILVEKKIITNSIREMKGFRNILVHKYGRVDDKRVFTFALENSSDFIAFVNMIEKFIELRR